MTFYVDIDTISDLDGRGQTSIHNFDNVHVIVWFCSHWKLKVSSL